MNKILKIFFLILFVSTTAVAQAPVIKEDLVALSNKVLLNIFLDINSEKGRFEELVDFGDSALTKNRHGIYAINYGYDKPNEAGIRQPIEFALTIVHMDDQDIYSNQKPVFYFGFPLLNLKIAGYQIRNSKFKQYDIMKSVRRYGQMLLDKQQEYLPLQLTLKTSKEEFKTEEDIEFTVTLTNVTNRNLKVKDLNDETLYFLINNTKWGAKELNPKRGKKIHEVVLKPNESIRKTFKATGFLIPKTLEIYCSYVMTYKGIKPARLLKVKVIK